MRDTTLLYQGGSAGFMMYYYLLLSGDYEIESIDSVKQDIVSQFPATLSNSRNLWKTFEKWPLNELHTVTKKPKLYFTCNPLHDSDTLKWNKDLTSGTTVILLYTDIKTQVRLAFEKKAYWFSHNETAIVAKEVIRNAITWNGVQTDPANLAIASEFSVTKQIYLQDFLDTKQGNNDQQEFIEYWKSLQSAKARRLLCI